MATFSLSDDVHSTTPDSHGSEKDIIELASRPRRIRQRLPAEEGGYACPFPGCQRIFDRKSELTKHGKYHLPEQDRPIVCKACARRFLFQKDLRRHQNNVHTANKEAPHPCSPVRLSSQRPSPVIQNKFGIHDLQDARAASLEAIRNTDDPTNGLELNPTAATSIPTRFQYQRISSETEIRLLELHPGQALEPLQCTLTCVNFEADSPPQYEALSYLWGTDIEDQVPLPVNGHTMTVTSNLYSALTRLRKSDQVRNMWVDSICINQHDIKEKNDQVSRMREIFENATQVCIWLGLGDENSELAFRFVDTTVSDLSMIEEFTSNPNFAPEWKALASVMNSPLFSRRWIIQEICLAKSITLYCGRNYLPWTDFEVAVSLLERHQAVISKIFRASKEAEFDSAFFGDVQAMGAARLVELRNKLFFRDNENRIVEYRYQLADLVAELSTFGARDPRDMIYAVLALAKDTYHRMGAIKTWQSANFETRKRGADALQDPDDTHQPPVGKEFRTKRARIDENEGLTELSGAEKRLAKAVVQSFQSNLALSRRKWRIFNIDYTQSPFEVYKLFLDYALLQTPGDNNLDILCKPWALVNDRTELPSWVTTIADAPFEMRPAKFAPGGQQIARKNPDSLVSESSTANLGRSPYNACPNRRATEWRFGDRDRYESELSLFVSGFLLDKIGEIETFSQYGNIPAEWFQLAGWHPWSDNGEKLPAHRPPEQLWKTLVADRDSDGSSPQVYFSKAFEYAIEHSTPTTGLETTNLMRRSNPILLEFLKRMSAVVWNRKLFKPDGHTDLLGLAPKKAKEGDVICVLQGCSVPVVLREHRENGHAHFEFIGPCYLHTMMDGRAIDVQKEKNIPTQELELR